MDISTGTRNIIGGPSRYELSVALFERILPSDRRSVVFILEGREEEKYVHIVITSCLRLDQYGQTLELKGLVDPRGHSTWFQTVSITFSPERVDGRAGNITISEIRQGNPDGIQDRYEYVRSPDAFD